ncbi:MAG: Ig-like domain-containing protein [Myxococcota bacterium]
MRMRLGVVLLLMGAACPQQEKPEPSPQVAVEVEKSTLTADGVDQTTVTATFTEKVSRDVVVRFTTSAGILTASAVPLRDGKASTILVADREQDMGDDEEKNVTLRAIVELSDNQVVTNTTLVTFRVPAFGQPLIFLEARPPAVEADGVSTVEMVATARRMAAGTPVTWTTTAGTLAGVTSQIAANPDGTFTTSMQLTAAAEPVNARVTVKDPSSGAEAFALVSFVPAGAPQFDLTGTFAELALVRVKLSANTLRPNPQCVLAPSILRVQFTQNDHDVTARFKTCMVTLPPVTSIAGTVTNETPPAFLNAIPEVEDHITLEETVLGAELHFPPSVVVVGAELSDPANDPLPTDEDDSRVRDSDGDGQPGVTVINSLGGEQHIVYRNKGESRGTIVSSNKVEGGDLGDLTALTETAVFGIGGSFLPETIGLPSVFQMVRIDGLNGSPNVDNDGDGELSCQEVMDAQAQVFDLPTPNTPIDCGGI